MTQAPQPQAPRGMTLLSPELTDYVTAHAPPETDLFARLREETYAKLDAPQMQVGRVEGAFLRMLVQLTRARAILEVGTFSGYSGLSMAMALPDDGRLLTCDVNPVATAIARRYFDESGHGHKIEIALAPALETISKLAAEGARFDMVFLDADKENYSNYFDAALPLLPRGGLVVADNTLWSGRVLEPASASDHAIVEFNAKVRDDPRVEQVLLSIRDGIMLARKR
ncbi:MAG: class I SAM-dependent methyltransferase [Nannocystaceae bacterium]